MVDGCGWSNRRFGTVGAGDSEHFIGMDHVIMDVQSGKADQSEACFHGERFMNDKKKTCG